MTQKERLVNLLLPQLFMFSAVDCGKLADHLLDNGVIVPPCKVGDVLYVITTICGTSIDEVTVFSFTTMKHYVTINTIHKSNPLSPLSFPTDQLGKTIFFTREEAEQALKERNGND